ncbi:hypothetical protein [Mycobacterium marinum]|uniref:hypothetical protein n=1 Tax=Mycobacterium marinum TaxID=1781 RepID=UPI003561CEA5
MMINDPKASLSQVHGIFLSTQHARDNQILVPVKPGSLKVNGGIVTFTATVIDSDVEFLYVPPSERLANR